MRTMQETFDAVYLGIIKQGKPAYTAQGCHYRAPDGSKCAIGQLIPDDKYSVELEGHLVCSNEVLSAAGFDELVVDKYDVVIERFTGFLDELQSLGHDYTAKIADTTDRPFINVFKEEMKKIATEYNLTVPEAA